MSLLRQAEACPPGLVSILVNNAVKILLEDIHIRDVQLYEWHPHPLPLPGAIVFFVKLGDNFLNIFLHPTQFACA